MREEQQAQDQTHSQQPPQFSLNSALDGNVVSSLLSMKSTDLITLLRSLESNINEPFVGNDVKVAKDVNVHDMIDKRNSSSFAKLFSMKNADFKALLENQNTQNAPPQTVSQQTASQNIAVPHTGAQQLAGNIQMNGTSDNNLFSSMENDKSSPSTSLSRMRSGDLVDWIWSLEEDNLDAILSETEQLKQRALSSNTPNNIVPEGRSHTYESLVKDNIPQQGQPTELQRKLSDVYFGLDGSTEVPRDKPLATNQLALLLQHQAFLAKRQEQQQAMQRQIASQSQVATSYTLPEIRHDESITNKTALELFEEIIEEQQDNNINQNQGTDTNQINANGVKIGGTPNFGDGLVGSLAMALGHKTHSSLYVQKVGSIPKNAQEEKKVKNTRKPVKMASESEEEDDQEEEGDAKMLKKRDRRMKNKESAARSRLKKKTYTQSLEKVVESLKQENAELNQKYNELMVKRDRVFHEKETRDQEENRIGDKGINEDDEGQGVNRLTSKRRKLLVLYSLPKHFKL